MSGPRVARGVVLAGGRSSRFGTDKALAIARGSTLIAHAVGLLARCGLDPVVVSRPGWTYEGLGCTTIHDRQAHCGPLAGLHRAHQEYPNDALLALTCDMPYLNAEDLRGLLGAFVPGVDAVLYSAATKGAEQPFPGLYASEPLRRIDPDHLSSGPSMHSYIRSLARVIRLEPRDAARRLANINAPDDLDLSPPAR
ncbi:MAG: Molybdenum cofactor guanylyltransferase [Candidatus Omnitrophica bacterium]|nr:Molybdenum cofactor guanylyltransferase [Candidatus Omnitrophota bacterium]